MDNSMIKEIDIGGGVLVRLLYYPHARHAIVESIKQLSDLEYQKREWIEKAQARGRTVMPYIIHTLYDDYGDLENLDVCIQKIDILFYNEEEAYLVHDLCYFLMEEIDDINDDMGYIDTEYISHPKWPQLIAKAAIAYTLMKANNEKYNFIEHDDGYWEQKHRDGYRNWQEKFELERGKNIDS